MSQNHHIGRLDCSQNAVVSQLYAQTAKLALSKTLKMVRQSEVAQEIVQEAFVRLWKSQAVFDDVKQAYVWIYKCCHNLAIDYLRSAKHKYESPGTEPSQVDTHADPASVEHFIQADDARALLSKLSKQEAQIVAYIAFDGFTQEETADMLGISRKTVTRALFRIRNSLNQQKEAVND